MHPARSDDHDRTIIAVEAGAVRAALRLEGLRIVPRLVSRDARSAHVALVSGGALLLPGDAVRLHVRVGAGCALHLEDIGGMVAYGGTGERSHWSVDADIEPRGTLVWSARPLVVADGARVQRATSVRLGADGVALLRETVVLGRAGERGGSLDSRLRIDRAGRPLLIDGVRVSGEAPEPGVLGDQRVLDGVVLAGIRPPAHATDARVLALDGPGALARHLGADTHSSPLHEVWPMWLDHVERHQHAPDPTPERSRA
ncbi:urease accessory protein UreD [Microbacterium sp.]|uniref:urease accessory protein UreD n=1 Tax=Microbacterium sp. TaxID=51671 RepID=UPI0039E4AB5E